MKDLHRLLQYKDIYYLKTYKIRYVLDEKTEQARQLYKEICQTYFLYDHKYEFDIALNILGNLDLKLMNVMIEHISDQYFRDYLREHVYYEYMRDLNINHKRYIKHSIKHIIEILYAIIYEDYSYMIDIKDDYHQTIDYEHLYDLYYEQYKHIFDLVENQINMNMFHCSDDAINLLMKLIRNELSDNLFIDEIKEKFNYMILSYDDYYNHYNDFKTISYFPIRLFTHEYHQFMCLCQLGILKLLENDLYNNEYYIKEYIKTNLNLKDKDLLLQTKLFMTLKHML